MESLFDALQRNEYPGRGIFVGRTADGRNAIAAYFIMGRSENSRNRVFVVDGDGIRTKAFDESKVTDPRLIIYSPVRTLGNKTIITNGDQTDTIYNAMDRQLTFEQSLRNRTYEPDVPNYTPRISAVLRVGKGDDSLCNYALSIIKKNGDGVVRSLFAYEYVPAGEGRLVHTYMGNGNPLPSFEGEPTRVSCRGGVDTFTDLLWQSLNADNKVSLWVRFIDIGSGEEISRIVNKNGTGQ